MTRRAAITALAVAFAAFSQARGEWVTEVVTNYNVPASYFYVRGGLISQWDGIDNAGFGVHNASATTWKDLIGGLDISLPNKHWTDCGYDFNGNEYGHINWNPDLASATIEAVFDWHIDSNTYANYVGWPSQQGGSAPHESIGYWPSSGLKRAYNLIVATDIGLTSQSDSIRTMSGVFGITDGVVYGDGGRYSVASVNMKWGGTPNCGFTIYGYWNSSASSTAFFGKGVVNCVRVYSRALSAAEIAHNYELDSYRFMGGATPSFPLYLVTTNRVYRAPAPMRSYDAQHPFNAPTARTRLGGTGSGEDGTTLRPTAHFDIKRNEED